MTDDEPLEPADEILVGAGADPGAEVEPAVTFAIPPAAYATLATDDDDAEPAPELPADPGPGPDALAPVLGAVAALGEGLVARLDALQARFDREVRAEATREKVVDRLHAELQEYKQGLVLNILRPVFVDLIQLHDDIGKMADARPPAGGEAGAEVGRLLDLMRGYQQGIEDILYRQGVEPFSLEGDTFDPRRQRALATVPTDDPGLNKRVAARLRKGFQAGDKVIRPEMVTVHSFK